MTIKDDSKEKPAPQGEDPKITKIILPEKITYDVKGLKEFLDFVFEGAEDDENILVWKTSSKSPGFPQPSPENLLHRLERSKAPTKLYFGTSTVAIDNDGNLRNLQTLFKAFYVLVLDDIGTKVPLDKIPADLTPTYIIETSEGNFQYGYVLEEPITVREQAKTLVQLAYEGGFSDAGGKTANKLVRLPEGVNGKNGSQFRCRLTHFDKDMLWSPKDILDTLDLGVTWQEVVDDAEAVIKSRASKGAGVGVWSPIDAELGSMDGIVDPVAEWLYAEGKVLQETDGWLTIKCPWSDTHTDGNVHASYSPLGWGGPEFMRMRSFNCFHEHCAAQKTEQFLQNVADHDGPNASAFEPAGHLLSTYVFDKVDNGVWEVKGRHQPLFQPLAAWRNDIPGKIKIYLPGEKIPKLIPATTAFIQARNRVTVEGQTYEPTTVNKIVADSDGKLRVNMYTQPDWGDGDYAEADISMFMDFMSYLIPREQSREYFLDWLAAKTQSMAFRGPGILMIAPSQGTGRTTLGNMIATMFGKENVEKVPFETLSKGQGATYNDWIVKPIIITDETLALGDDQKKYAVYERLKEMIDTTPEEVRVNPKYGKQRFQTTYSSFLLFSNHEDAMQIADNDRRIAVMNNVSVPADPKYFVELHEWLDKGTWAQAVWRWLRQRDVNVGDLVKPPEDTKAKDDMIAKGKQPVDIAVDTALANWPSKIVAYCQIRELFKGAMTLRLHLGDPKTAEYVYRKRFENGTFKVDTGKMRIMGNGRPVRFIKSKREEGDGWMLSEQVENADIAHEVTREPTDEQKLAILTAIDTALDENDF